MEDQGALELDKGPHDRQQQRCHRRVLPGEHQAFLDEFDPHSLAGQRPHQAPEILKIAREPVHRVHQYDVALAHERQHLCQPWLAVSLPEARSVKIRSTSTLSSCQVGGTELP